LFRKGSRTLPSADLVLNLRQPYAGTRDALAEDSQSCSG
jgi:hypothetical protein